MSNYRDKMKEPNQLRACAQGLANKKQYALKDTTPGTVTQLLEDLKVHQLELEMQNDELRRAQLELDETMKRYTDLYDFAPVGYYTLNAKGFIIEANLTLADMLGVVRGAMIGVPFSSYIEAADQGSYFSHRRGVIETATKQTHELRLTRGDGSVFYALLETIPISGKKGPTGRIRSAVIDISERKKAALKLKAAYEMLEDEVAKRTTELVRINKELRGEIDIRKTVAAEKDRLVRQLELERGRLSAVLTQIPAGVIIAEAPSGKLLFGNSQVESILGHQFFPVDSTDQYSRYSGHYPDGKPYEIEDWPLTRSILHGEYVRSELIHYGSSDEAQRLLEVSSAPIRDARGDIIAGVVIFHDVSELLKAQEESRQYSVKLKSLSARIVQAQEAERKRIALELHDEMGQRLTVMSINLQILERKLSPDTDSAIDNSIDQIRTALTQVSEQTHDLAVLLHPSILDDLGLVPALRWFVEDYSRRTGIDVTFDAAEDTTKLDEKVTIVIYRIVQEAFTNISKHAEADNALIRFRINHQEVEVKIEDNGKGFNFLQVSKMVEPPYKLGLIGIKERVDLLGGRFRIESAPQNGTMLLITIPLDQGKSQWTP